MKNKEFLQLILLYGVEIVLFSENPIISILSKEDFINQVNQITNSYINF